MSNVTTHVLDTARGVPASGVPVRLEEVDGDVTRFIADGITDADGRITDLAGDRLPRGTYRLTFDTGAYAAAHDEESFFPDVAVTFVVGNASVHCHVPLLLSPFSYTTYRGS